MGGEYKFYFLREKSVYFNIRGEGSVIQGSLRGEECNLLLLNQVDGLKWFMNLN